jgi:two-component system, LuxR family, sensor histidine kinase DctS
MASPRSAFAPAPGATRWRRALLWTALLALLGVAQTLLLGLTVRYESGRAQGETEAVAVEAVSEMRRELLRITQSLQALSFGPGALAGWGPAWREEGLALLRQRPELRRIELRRGGPGGQALEQALDTPYHVPLFARMQRSELQLEAELACTAARRATAPMFSRSYFVPLAEGDGLEVIDLCVPVIGGQGEDRYLVGTMTLPGLLELAMTTPQSRRHELSFIEGDGTRVARAGEPRGVGVFQAERVLDLPGTSLQLRADSAAGRPSLVPNLATALVLGLSFALFAVVLLLARDVRRRARAEHALAEALAFRKAMEDSLSTGLRARDLSGAITYVNPAFCAMVGFAPEELTSAAVPPYWPPEHVPEYQARQRLRLGSETGGSREAQREPGEAREGFETVFMRKSGERFPVMIYEAPLVDGDDRHTGWMSAVLDLSEQRRVEELSRQQQDRLQATARLTTVGEMASLLSHELNQPLAAIASYASGSLNLIEDAQRQGSAGRGTLAPPADDSLYPMLRQALGRIAEQAERAGRIIKSVHDFVRRREHQHEIVGVDVLIEAVLPLARLQARKSGTRIELDLPGRGEPMPRVRCDRTLLEQVLLNLARNGIQAMETAATPPPARVLTLRVRQTHPRWVGFQVIDAGPGIAADVAERLFTPFFTTRSEGMGLGLSLCRTVIEQHGGALDFGPGPWRDGQPRGTEFRFTLPSGDGPRDVSRDSLRDSAAGGGATSPDPAAAGRAASGVAAAGVATEADASADADPVAPEPATEAGAGGAGAGAESGDTATPRDAALSR